MEARLDDTGDFAPRNGDRTVRLVPVRAPDEREFVAKQSAVEDLDVARDGLAGSDGGEALVRPIHFTDGLSQSAGIVRKHCQVLNEIRMLAAFDEFDDRGIPAVHTVHTVGVVVVLPTMLGVTAAFQQVRPIV